MTKQEMIKYIENYKIVCEEMLKEHEKKYPNDNFTKDYLKTKLETYEKIFKDFTKKGE